MRSSLPTAYWCVWWGTLINRLGGFIVPLLTIFLTTQRGVDVKVAGLVAACFGVGQVGAAFVGGQLADRVGRRATMVLSMFSGSLAMLALGRSHGAGELAALVVAVGFFGELYRPAVAAFISDTVAPAERPKAYGLLYWAINIGFAFAGTVGGLVASVDFSLLFYADAITSVAFGVIVAVAVPETRPPATARAPRPSVFRDRDFLVVVAINFLIQIIRTQTWAPLAVHMTGQGFSPAAYGIVMAANGILIVLFQPAITSAIAGRDPSQVLAASAGLCGLGMAMHGLATAAFSHAIAVAIWTVSEICAAAILPAMVAAMAPVSARGRYQGVLGMSFGLAQIAGPALGMWVYQQCGPATLWNGSLAAAAIAVTCVLATAPARRRRLDFNSFEPRSVTS